MTQRDVTRRAVAAAGLLALPVLAGCQLDRVLRAPRPPAAATSRGATRLAFVRQPSATLVGASITPAVAVAAQDDSGRADTTFTGSITIVIASGTGALAGTTTRPAAAGVATFPDLAVDRSGSGFRLGATGGGLVGATSASFAVTAAAPSTLAAMSGDAQTDTVAATLRSPYVVRVTDGAGQPVAGRSVTWTVTSGGGSLASVASTTDANGESRATHVLGTAAGPQAVTASSSGLAGSPATFTSTATAGAAASAAFTQQPTNAGVGAAIRPSVVVTLRDRYGNVATGGGGSVSMSIVPLTGTPLASLSGTTTRAVSGGAATFDDLSIDLPGLGYRLRAVTGALSVDSGPFNVP